MFIISVAAPLVLALSMTSRFHINSTVELDVKKRVYRRISNQIRIASIATIPSVGTALGPVFLPKKAAASVSASPGVNI